MAPTEEPKSWNTCNACGLRHTRATCPRCGGQGLGDQSPQQTDAPAPPRFVPDDPPSGGGDGGLMRIVIFVLIFGVGNFILYNTTGMVILPIPRK